MTDSCSKIHIYLAHTQVGQTVKYHKPVSEEVITLTRTHEHNNNRLTMPLAGLIFFGAHFRLRKFTELRNPPLNPSAIFLVCNYWS